uniref:Uncharacterized protein n=1 Tax=Accipiter nisus TaxID=211598 RepID=A0A8B9M1R5_9AVES
MCTRLGKIPRMKEEGEIQWQERSGPDGRASEAPLGYSPATSPGPCPPVPLGCTPASPPLWHWMHGKAWEAWGQQHAPVFKASNMDATSPLPSLGCQDPAMLEGDATLAPARALCPHLNGGLKMPGLPGKAGAKRRPCCQGDADGDIVLLSAVYPRHEECNHGFPLPATELGAAALVTTKTTQDSTGEERA